MVIKGAAPPLMQVNVPERFLKLVVDLKPKSSSEEHQEKFQKMLLPRTDAVCLAREPKNRPTRILTVALWLKLKKKYLNEGTAKEACTLFDVSIWEVPTPKIKGPKASGKNRKSAHSYTGVKEGGEPKEEDDDYGTHQAVKH